MSGSDDLNRNITDVAEALRDAKARNQPCSVLIGAGCSVSAGIPLANGFVEQVKQRYPMAWKRAARKDYPYVMRELDTGPRYRLIAEYVEKAKLNWAHVLLGWLVKNGYIGRILTTNFDNLVLRACSLYGVHPTVYDLAASSNFKPSFVQDPAVFFLHGQYGGFIQLHTREEVEKNAKLLRPAFENATVKRPWLIVGYSGFSDPVFENLVEIHEFADGLYWIGYRDEHPSLDVQERLLVRGRQAYLIPGYDADGFFVELFRELKLEAPLFVTDPFSHLLEIIDTLSPFPAVDRSVGVDMTHQTRIWLEKAKKEFVDNRSSFPDEQRVAKALKLLVEGDYDGVIALHPADDTLISEQFRLALAAAYVKRARRFEQMAASASEKDVGKLYIRADEDYSASVASKADYYAALNNWGVSLLTRVRNRAAGDTKELLARAEEKFHKALAVKPDHPSVMYNLACVYGLRGEVGEAISWLIRRSEKPPTLTRDRVSADPAFRSVRKSPEFVAFLSSLNK
jgi:tetratricopeptide (TPR) repeat protein